MITQFMLTKHDVTIPDAHEVYAAVAASLTAEELPYVGFKNVGHSLADLARLGERIVADGRRLVIEVVGANPETEREAARLALQVGADILIGGTHTDAVLEVIEGTPIGYYPTVGDVNSEPGRLRGTIDEIVSGCEKLVGTEGVTGTMLLGYRYTGDVELLLHAVASVPGLQVVNAGSVDSRERIRRLADLDFWAFTIGSAVLDSALPAAPSLAAQLRWAVDTAS
ncbi:hypothetical protein AB0E67_35275 [Streptomyces sp. NPDC032161]|uniref:hypothetical protein n=1 Tax=unclassified Streptomyces TaxID=2593676 RepID=UPI0033D12F54